MKMRLLFFQFARLVPTLGHVPSRFYGWGCSTLPT